MVFTMVGEGRFFYVVFGVGVTLGVTLGVTKVGHFWLVTTPYWHFLGSKVPTFGT